MKAAAENKAKIFFSKNRNYMNAGNTNFNSISIGKLFFFGDSPYTSYSSPARNSDSAFVSKTKE